MRRPPAKEHKQISVDPKLFDGYVGNYQLAPNFILTVTRTRQSAFVQATGQGKAEVFPESEKDFFYKVVDAQITFETDGTGSATELILHQNGMDQRAKKAAVSEIFLLPLGQPSRTTESTVTMGRAKRLGPSFGQPSGADHISWRRSWPNYFAKSGKMSMLSSALDRAPMNRKMILSTRSLFALPLLVAVAAAQTTSSQPAVAPPVPMPP